MARIREFDEQQALDKAMTLFWTKGYSDTSMDDLVNATGVSRYGLYGSFGNKRGLFERALSNYSNRLGRQSFLRLTEPDSSVRDIRELFEQRVDWLVQYDPRRGCLICNTALELASHDKEIGSIIKTMLKKMSKAFSIALSNAKTRGELDKDMDVKAMGEYLTGLVFGMTGFARAGFDRKTITTYMENGLKVLG